MTRNEELKSGYEAALQGMFAALRKDDRYKEEIEACEASKKRYEDQDTRDRVLGALKDSQDEANNLWDGCNHMIDEADEAHAAARKAFGEAMKRYGDDYDPGLWAALEETETALEQAKVEAEAVYKVYCKAEDTYLEAVKLLEGASQD